MSAGDSGRFPDPRLANGPIHYTPRCRRQRVWAAMLTEKWQEEGKISACAYSSEGERDKKMRGRKEKSETKAPGKGQDKPAPMRLPLLLGASKGIVRLRMGKVSFRTERRGNSSSKADLANLIVRPLRHFLFTSFASFLLLPLLFCFFPFAFVFLLRFVHLSTFICVIFLRSGNKTKSVLFVFSFAATLFF